MAVSYPDLVYIIVSTVAKLMLIVIVGYFSISRLKYSNCTVRGIGYITLYTFLPCLLAPSIITNTTVENISLYYWAIILSLVPMSLGFAMSMLMRLVIPKEYIGLLVLGSTFQNGLSFPLSITMAIRGLDWIDDDGGRSQCESFIFLYNVVCAIMIFLVGDQWVVYCKNKEVKEQQKAEQLALEGDADSMSPIHAGGNDAIENGKPTSEGNETATPSSGDACHSIKKCVVTVVTGVVTGVKQVCSSPPVFASVVSLFVALVPPLRWLIETKPGTMVLTSMTYLGNCSIPLQLIVQGCSMARTDTSALSEKLTVPKKQTSPSDGAESDGAVQNAQESSTESLSRLQRVRNALKSPYLRLSILVIALRLIVVPAVGMILLHILRVAHVIPSTPIFIFAMLLEFCSPTALNSSLLCVMHNYHAQMYAVIIFYMYVCSIFTIVFWLFVDILYIEKLVITK